jgi:hypothetical protein
MYGVPVKENVEIFQGSLVVSDGGYAAPGTAATGKIALGRAEQTVDNTGGANGAKSVNVKPGCFLYANKGGDTLAISDRGALCYISDDQTVCKTGTGKSIAGTVIDVVAQGVWVQIGITPGVDGTALAAEIAAREDLIADLASTANAKGASLIGIEDAGSLITATTVEGALAEKLDGRRIANLADDAVIGGVPVVMVVAIADGVTADKDIVLTHKTEVIDVIVEKTAGAGGTDDTITVKNGANAITNAISIDVADKTIVRAGTIDDATAVIAAAGTLRITKTKVAAANVACKVTIIGIRRA